MSGKTSPGLTLYMAVNEFGYRVSGTAAQIADKVGISVSYVQQLARTGAASRNGWTVERIAEGERSVMVYTAERDGDDPITGTADEVAALTGYTVSSVRKCARSGSRTRDGWSFRAATPDEISAVDGV